ncbi:MAG: hypothetical protein C0469_00680 [Cyanobacteria bacterium DS2.3.42]|nr:hypothetical protein [Cyanobacteria bacterium DS2.3.42]
MEVKVMCPDPVAKTIPLFDPNSELAKRALGTLIAEMSGTKKELPLAGVDIDAKVADRICDVTVKQKFRNTFADHLEAVYIFPLAYSAVVTSFELRVGARIVKGLVKERQEARQEYQAAITAGKRSALMEQERDDIFTMQVGNIAPGEEVSVEIKYSERLPFFEDGTCEIRLPLVVAPRYISGQPKSGSASGLGTEVDTDEVPDASRITPPRLAPGAKDNVQLSVSVELMQSADGTFNVKDLASSQHVVSTSLDNGSIKVELSQENEIMNRDFILKWVLAEKTLKPNLVSYCDDKGNTYCMLTVLSPKQDKFLGVPRDVVFIVDRSGSMGGLKMASAAKSCSILLDTLGPQDRFAICAFDTVNEWMEPHKEWSTSVDGRFVCADEAGIDSGKAYLRTVTARGGTELEPALAESLGEFKKRQKADAIGIIVILTDGQVGNESGVYKRLQSELGDARVFTVGIDTAVNGGILTRMATLGGGTSALVTPGAKLEKALSQIGREIGVPVLTGLKLEAVQGNLEGETVTPANLPDLFRGRASTIFFKMTNGLMPGKGKKKIRIKGTRADGSAYVEDVIEKKIELPAVASLYAKSLIRDLEDMFREHGDRNKIRKRIIDLSLQHSVLCRFTAFIAVDEAEVVNKDGSVRTVVQPVHQPAEWEVQDTTTYGSTQITSQFAGSVGSSSLGASSFGAPTLADSIRQRLAESAQDAVTGCWGSPAQPQTGGPPPAPAAPSAWGQPPSEPAGGTSGGWGGTFGASPPPPPAGGPNTPFLGKPGSNFPQRKSSGEPPAGFGAPIQERGSITPSGSVSPSELLIAINEMVRLFSEVVTQFMAGVNVDWKLLEDGRAKCLKHLQSSRFAASAPKLQQFLRSEAVEIIAAIKVGALSSELTDRLKDALDGLKNEADAITQDREPVAAAGNFWENSV